MDNFSQLYEYSFAHYDWPQYFCPQPVVRDYFARCATDFGIRPHIRFEHEVEAAEYDEESGLWTVRITDQHGVSSALETNALISAVGQLNQPRLPDIDGRDDFTGPAFHSARWDTSLELTGKRVAVIGTGASGDAIGSGSCLAGVRGAGVSAPPALDLPGRHLPLERTRRGALAVQPGPLLRPVVSLPALLDGR